MEDDMKQTLKKIKQFIKRLGRKVFILFLPIIIIVLILLAAAVYFITIDDGTYKEDDWSSMPYATQQYSEKVAVDSSGVITTEMTANELWEKTLENGSRADLYLDNPEQLKKLMNAEIVTQYVDTRSNPSAPIDWDAISKADSNQIQGIIKLKRKMSDGTSSYMSFVDSATFDGWIEEYNKTGSETVKNNIKKRFTMRADTVSPEEGETEKYYVEVATWSKMKEKIESNEDGVDNKTTDTYSMTTTRINYQDLVSGYTMPFDYLWSFLVVSEDKEMVLDLADLVYNSKIEITVHDNTTKVENVREYTYTKKEKTDTKAKVTATGKKSDNSTEKKTKEDSWSDVKESNYRTKITTNTETNTLDISVTLADVWMAKYTQDYTNQIPETISSSSTGDLDDIPYPAEPSSTTSSIDTYGHAKDLKDTAIQELKDSGSYTSVTGTINNVNEKIYYSYTNRKDKNTNTMNSNKYVSSPLKVEEKVDKNSAEPNFITVFLDPEHSSGKRIILDTREWLFELLEENEDTVDMVDLTKYLLYKATNTSYGVTEYYFDTLYTTNLSTVGIGDYTVDITKSSENIVIEDLETLKKAFSGYPGSQKLIEHAQEFLDLQEKYKVNAVFAAAVSITETSAGRMGHASDGKKNWFNIECTCGDPLHGRFETYSSDKESIEKFYWLIAEGTYYFKQGKYTVTDIGMIYCEDADVPGGWIENTNAFMTQMFEAAGIDAALYAGTRGGITTEEERVELQNYIENELIHTKYHKNNSMYQNGPFAKWWDNPYNLLESFQCTWWANGKASMYLEQFGTKYKKYPTQGGNGGEYYDKNKANGWFKYGLTPKPHSLVTWKKSGSWGHVAYVEGVGSDGIYISEAGSGTSWFGVRKIPLSGYYSPSFTLVGYIYLNEPN